MFGLGLDGTGAAVLRSLGDILYRRWLELRFFFIGLRITWISTASAVLGLALFLTPQVRDMLLDVRGDPWSFWTFWTYFYVIVILFWVLPVFVSARWILARFEAGAGGRWYGELVPARVRSAVPAFLAVFCFAAIFIGQLMALGTAPMAVDPTVRFPVGGDTSASFELRQFLQHLAIQVGAKIIGERSYIPLYGVTIAASLVLWFYIGRRPTSQMRPQMRSIRRYLIAIMAYVAIGATTAAFAFAKWGTTSVVKSSLPLYALLVFVPLLLILLWLAWRGAERLLWWLGAVFAVACAALLLFAIYGVMEGEGGARFSLRPLLLLPLITATAAALAWWLLRRQPEGRATLVGQLLLARLGAKEAPTGEDATKALVNPIFYGLLAFTAALAIYFFVADPLYLTEPWRPGRPWHLNRALLLPVVLGMLVATLTGLTFLSARWRAPLLFAAVAVVAGLGLLKAELGRDPFAVDHVKSPKALRPTLEEAVKQWAAANGCDLPKSLLTEREAKNPCPAPVIVVASGGASRAAFQVAGVIGKLMDNDRWSPMHGHTDFVLSAVFSRVVNPSDPRLIVTASADGTARIWDAKRGVELGLLRHGVRVNGAAFSRNGKLVVTASWDRTAKIWDVSSLSSIKELKTLVGHKDGVNGIAFSPDETLIATASDDATAIIWDAETGDMLAVLQGHKDKARVSSVAFSPDGKRLVTASWDRTAKVWDAPSEQQLKEARETKKAITLKEKITLSGHTGDINSATFSPDPEDKFPEGKLIATASDDMTAVIWDGKTGAKLAVLGGHKRLVYSVAFSPDGKRIVTASWDRTAKVWDTPSEQQLKEARETKKAIPVEAKLTLKGHTADVNSAAFSSDGESIVTASDDKTARIWDASTGYRKGWEQAFGGRFDKQLFAISGVSGGSLGAAVIYAAVADSLAKHTGGANDALKPPCNKDGLYNADWFAAKRKVGRTQSLASEQQEPSEDPTRSWKACLQLLVAGDFLSPVFIGISRDLLHPLWWFKDVDDRAKLLEKAWTKRYAKLTSPSNDIATLAKPMLAVRSGVKETGWLPILLLNGTSVDDGKRIITTDMRNEIGVQRGRVFFDVHDFHDFYSEPRYRGHTAPIFHVAATLDGSRVITASDDGTARIWDVKTGVELGLLAEHSARVHSAVFSGDRKLVVTASWDRTAKIWDVSEPQKATVLKTFEGHKGDLNSAVFSPDKKLIATASDDTTAVIWDAETGDRLAVLVGHRGWVYSVAFSPDGKRVVTASWDRTAKVWDAPSPQELMEARATKTAIKLTPKMTLAHTGNVNGATFSPDPEGALIATASDDMTAVIWDAKTGYPLATLSGHKGQVRGVAFSPDGKRVITGAMDRTAMIWEVPSAQELGEARDTKLPKLLTMTMALEGHADDINAVAFIPGSQWVVTASADKTARIWDLETGKTRIVLQAYKDRVACDDCDIGLSTAVTMSARFPIISPTGNILDRAKKTVRRVVDGGYHDYLGAVTATELVKALEVFRLQAAVIFINNDPNIPSMECVRPPESEVADKAGSTSSLGWSPLDAIIATGAARGTHAIVSLCEMLGPERFAFVTVKEERGKALSMNWWLSKYVQYYLDAQLGDPVNKEAFDTISKMRQGPSQPRTITLLGAPIKAASK